MEAPYRPTKTVYRHQGSNTHRRFEDPTLHILTPHLAMLSRRPNTRWRSNRSLCSLVIVFAQATTLIGSMFFPQVLIRDHAYSDSAEVSAWNGWPSFSRDLSRRSPPSSSPRRQHTFDLLFDPEGVLDIRPMLHVDTDDIRKSSKRAEVRSLKSRPLFKSMPPPPYSLIDVFPLPAYTP